MADGKSSDGGLTEDLRTVRGLGPAEEPIRWLTVPVGARFQFERTAGVGGDAYVDVMRDASLGRPVARKVMHRPVSSDPDAVARFVREARITAQLDHPNIVPVHDVGLDASQRPVFFMKWVRGQSLEAHLESLPDEPWPWEVLLDQIEVVVRVCDALHFAHVRGVIHCDVKPHNVMVGESGEIYLMDWGVARVLADDEGRDPDPPSLDDIIGSPTYMAPEQAEGLRHRVDARTDVYGVGGVLYRIAARRPPRRARTPFEALRMAVTQDPEALSEDVPLGLRRIIERAMARDPRDRYPSMAELREDLVRFQRGRSDFERAEFAAGQLILQEGEAGRAAYRVLHGRCEIYRDRPGGRTVLDVVEPGGVFGEVAILGRGRRTASVRALEATVLEVLDRGVVEQQMRQMQPWMAEILSRLARRFSDADSDGPSS